MQIQDIYSSETGKLIKNHLENTVNKLDKISDIDTTLPNEKILVKVLARMESIETLKNILQLTKVESKSELKDNKKQKYGLK